MQQAGAAEWHSSAAQQGDPKSGTAVWHSRVAQQDGAANWHSRVAQQGGTTGWHSRVAQQGGRVHQHCDLEVQEEVSLWEVVHVTPGHLVSDCTCVAA